MKARLAAGYTLIEILAVLMLIGLLMMIVYPQFTNSPERNEVIYIGKLIKADVTLVKEEAFSSKEELVIDFYNKGYIFQVGDSKISRNFYDYQFSFEVSEPDELEDSDEEGEDTTPKSSPTPFPAFPKPSPTPFPTLGTEDLSGESNTGTTPTGFSEDEEDSGGDETSTEETKPNELIFGSDGQCNSFKLNWQTRHYCGALVVDENGVVTWTYEQN